VAVGEVSQRREANKDNVMRDTVCQSREEWEVEVQKMASLSDEIHAYKGRLSESAATLESVLRLQHESASWVQLLYLYADNNKEMLEKLDTVEAELKQKSEFIVPEIEEIGRKKIKQFMAENVALRRHRLYFSEIFRRLKIKMEPQKKRKRVFWWVRIREAIANMLIGN
jgi:oligoendopeptidase F